MVLFLFRAGAPGAIFFSRFIGGGVRKLLDLDLAASLRGLLKDLVAGRGFRDFRFSFGIDVGLKSLSDGRDRRVVRKC